MTTVVSLFGIVVFLLFAFTLSSQRSAINWRTVGLAFLLQFALGAFALYIPQGKSILSALSQGVSSVIGYSDAGVAFVFGNLGNGSLGFVFALNVLPVIIFFSALIAILYYLNIMDWVIRILGGAMQRVLATSRAESLSAAANIFVSQTEAPVVIRPYLSSMSKSEIFAVMVGGMATVAGSVLAGYVGLGVELKYLLAASFMAAPGAFLMAKMLVPETDSIDEHKRVTETHKEDYCNIIDAAAGGAANGLKLAVNIGAMLLAFISLIALLNGVIGGVSSLLGNDPVTLQEIIGYCFMPVAFLLGIPWSEASTAGSLIGQKLVFNEFLAFAEFAELKTQLNAHSQAVVTFALCGFANFSSIAILLGGLGTMAPNRRTDIAKLGMRAVIAAFLANLVSAGIASFFLSLSADFIT